MGVKMQAGPLKVYLDGVEISPFVRDITTVSVEQDLAVDIRSCDLEGLVRLLTDLSNEPVSLSVSHPCPRGSDVDEVIAEVAVKYRGGSVSVHKVYNILMDSLGTCIFVCDDAPKIPEGVFSYMGNPMKFVKREQERDTKTRHSW